MGTARSRLGTPLRAIGAALLSGLPLLVASACQPQPTDRLTVYSGRSATLVGPLFTRFEEATGIDVDVRYGGSAELAALLLEEGENSPADVYFGQDAGALGALARSGPRADGRGASLCLVGSTAGRFGEAGHVEYAVSKAGLRALVLSLKNEIVDLDPYGRVNMVEPGWTITPMTEELLDDDELVQRVLATTPVRQVARAEDIASVVAFLSAPGLSRHVSGEVITVSGGMEGRMRWRNEEVDPATVRRRLDAP